MAMQKMMQIYLLLMCYYSRLIESKNKVKEN